MSSICDTCVNWVYDDEEEDYFCNMELDEDDVARYYQSGGSECHFYVLDDEYAVVRHQM